MCGDDDLDDAQCILCTDEEKRMKKAQSFEQLAVMAIRGQLTSEELDAQIEALTSAMTKEQAQKMVEEGLKGTEDLDFTRLGI